MKRTPSVLVALVLALVTALVFPGHAVHASPRAQTLPPMSWYAVVWDQGADTLHWVNINGEAASRARPQLPSEAVGSSNPDMRISPNGRYLVETATLTTGLSAVGIFDFQADNWVQVHIAAPGEYINLGHRHIFDRNSTHVAVGFAIEDYSAPSWHLTVYDLATGNPIATLNSGALAGVSTASPFVRPAVRYYTTNSSGQEVVHFQLVQLGTEPSETWPAYAWQPLTGTVVPSAYTRSHGDVNFLSGEEVFAYNDPAFTSLPAIGPGPSYNAIGRGTPVFGTPSVTRVWVDGTHYHYNARWAKGDEWVLFYTDDGAGNGSWGAAYANVHPNTHTLFGPTVTDAVGTPQGFLKVTDTLAIYHVSDFEDYLGGTQVFQASGAGPLRIVYVTPTGATFTLAGLGSSSGPVVVFTLEPAVIITPPSEAILTLPPAVATCPDAPPPRLTVGQPARVTFTDGTPLRVRAAPGGAVLTQIPEGTVVQVIGGPQCQGQYNWWQIQLEDGTQGWSAEGDREEYYLEPWALSAPPPQLPTLAPPVFVPTPTPLTLGVPPAALVTLPPPVLLGPPNAAGDCSQAPPARLQVGMQVVTAPTEGTYALFANLEDPTPYRQVPPNTTATVIGEPSCKNGYRFWPVSLTLNGEALTGWLSEGTQQAYFLLPTAVQ